MDKINRFPNRLGKLISAAIEKECRPRKAMLWGQLHDIAPAFVDTGRGDRRQLVWVQPIDTRPDYYVLRIDSKEDIDAEDYNYDELLLCPIEEEYDSASRYNWCWDAKGNWIGFCPHDENEPPITDDWPLFHWSGGSWGVIKNFG